MMDSVRELRRNSAGEGKGGEEEEEEEEEREEGRGGREKEEGGEGKKKKRGRREKRKGGKKKGGESPEKMRPQVAPSGSELAKSPNHPLKGWGDLASSRSAG